MSHVFRTTRRVEFCLTDAAGIMHFASFFCLMEQAEHELLRSVGLSVIMPWEGVTISWPRVAVRCDYRSAARFEDVLEVEVRVTRLGEKSITYAFRLLNEGKLSAEGEITAVCCQIDDHAPPQSIPIPADIRAKLSQFLAGPT